MPLSAREMADVIDGGMKLTHPRPAARLRAVRPLGRAV
jgi:hypothetical protein